jgi:2Fe-2S iron-sulfur cluster binding domain
VSTEDKARKVEEAKAIHGDVFRHFERLVEIKVLGKPFQVPEKNTVLRCFQYLSPETIPYGRFCWNQECQYCRVTTRLPDDDEDREMLSCKFLVSNGLEVVDMSDELKMCLRRLLPAKRRGRRAK